MTKGKGERQSGLTRLESGVTQLVGQSRQAQAAEAAQAAGKDGRGRPGHAGELGRDKAGLEKATYALPVSAQAMIREIAEAEDVSRSDIVHAAAVAFYNAWKAGRVDLNPLKRPTKSLRFSWVLEIEDDFFWPD
jgi:hypothetical protein